jgi:hypothetical protein
MAKYTRKEFAALCHTTVLVINTNKQRDNIIVGSDKKIDSDNAINKSFFDRYQNKFNDNKKTVSSIAATYPEVVKPIAKAKAKPKTKLRSGPAKKTDDEINDLSSQAIDHLARKKKADADLQEYKAAHEKLKMDKMAGKLIPVDLVFRILNIHNKSIFSTFQSDAENLASVYCEILAEGDRAKLSEVTDKLSKIINDYVVKAKDLSEIELENAIAEYSEHLNIGQRK